MYKLRKVFFNFELNTIKVGIYLLYKHKYKETDNFFPTKLNLMYLNLINTVKLYPGNSKTVLLNINIMIYILFK